MVPISARHLPALHLQSLKTVTTSESDASSSASSQNVALRAIRNQKPRSRRTRSDAATNANAKPSPPPPMHQHTRKNTEPPACHHHHHHRLTTPPWCSSLSTGSLALSPRPYEALFAERAYLTTSLGLICARKNDAIAQYAWTQVQLELAERGESAKPRRKLRKRLSLLRSDVNETTEQQKALYIRLGELHIELESRDAWARAQQQQQQQQHQYQLMSPDGHVSDATSSYCSTSPSHASMGMATPSTPLNAVSPGFIPSWEAVDSSHVVPQGPDSDQGQQAETRSGVGLTLQTVDEIGEEYPCNQGLDYEYQSEADDDKPELRRRTSFDSEILSPREKRLSLPNLQSMWPAQ